MFSHAKSAAQTAIRQWLMKAATCGCRFRVCSSSLIIKLLTLLCLVATSSTLNGVLMLKTEKQSGQNIKASQIRFQRSEMLGTHMDKLQCAHWITCKECWCTLQPTRVGLDPDLMDAQITFRGRVSKLMP